VYKLLIASGYVKPVVKYLIPEFYDIQYVSDTVSANSVGASNSSVSYSGQANIGLFIPSTITYLSTISLQGLGYYDIIIN